jgi:hypothetical protein
LKSIFIIGSVVILGLLLAYLASPGNNAASQPGGAEEAMSAQPREIPPIDLNRPAVTETAAFALG